MIYVILDEFGNIKEANYDPFHPVHGTNMTEEEMLASGMLLPAPQLEEKDGLLARLSYNKDNGSLYYEYVERPLTQEEELQLIKQENQLLQQSMLELTSYAAMQDERLATQEQALLEMSALMAGGDE